MRSTCARTRSRSTSGPRPRRVSRRRRRPRRAARPRVEGCGLPRPGRRHRRAAARHSSRTAASRTSWSRAGSSACASTRATRRCAELAPAGIEFAPPRKESQHRPGRHDFEIVADASLSVEDDMRRRDFTVNAMARRLADRTSSSIHWTASGDLEQRVLRTVSPTSFARGPAAARPRRSGSSRSSASSRTSRRCGRCTTRRRR